MGEASHWETRQDKFGRTYYYNTKTEESRWDAPEGLDKVQEVQAEAEKIKADAEEQEKKIKLAQEAAEKAKAKKRSLAAKAVASLSAIDARRKWTMAKLDVEKAKVAMKDLEEKAKIARGKANRLHKVENEARIIVEAARRDADGWGLHIDERTGRSYYFNSK